MTYGSWSCVEEKLHFTPIHTLCQLKRDKGLFPSLPISLADRNGLKKLLRQIFSACVKFGGNRKKKEATSTSHLFWHVQSYPHLFTPQWGCMLITEFQFFHQFPPFESRYFSVLVPILLKLHILAHIIEGFSTAYGLCSCIKIDRRSLWKSMFSEGWWKEVWAL